ncbi:MAG: GNAT family N-acetyltransferase [Actinomycetota bacterium]
MAIEIRQVTSDDVDSCVAIFFEAFNDLHEKYHYPAEDPDDNAWLKEAIAHFLSTDPESSLIAFEGGAPAAFACAYRRESFWFLSFLFVRPGAQSKGLGRTLLERVLPPKGERDSLTLATVVESFQSVSTGLYASYGIAPRVPRYRLSGLRPAKPLPGLPDGWETTSISAYDIDDMSDLDRRLLGYARPQEHEAWLSDPVRGFAYRKGGRLEGYAYLESDGIGPVASGDEETTVRIVGHLVSLLDEPGKVGVSVFGWSAKVLRVLLEAGMRMDPASYPFVYCSTDPRVTPSYLPFAGYLP